MQRGKNQEQYSQNDSSNTQTWQEKNNNKVIIQMFKQNDSE